MAYTPTPPETFTGPFLPSVGLTPLWAAHNEVFAAYRQQLGTYFGELATTGSTPMVWRFRCRANAGLRQVRVVYRHERSSGSGNATVTLASSVDTDTATLTAGGPTQGVVTVDVGGADEELTLTLVRTTDSGAHRLLGWSAFTLAGDYPEFVPSSGARWQAAGLPVNVEHIDRMLNGPVSIAKDGPHCLFSHFAPDLANLAGIKSRLVDLRYWGMVGSSVDAGSMTQVGYGAVHVTGTRSRVCTVDSWIEVTDEHEALLRIGGWEWSPGVGRDRTTVTLAPGFHTVVAALKVPANEDAVWHSLQVWRL